MLFASRLSQHKLEVAVLGPRKLEGRMLGWECEGGKKVGRRVTMEGWNDEGLGCQKNKTNTTNQQEKARTASALKVSALQYSH